MAYAENKEPTGLTALTSLDSGDVFVVGDASDANEVAKKITKTNLITDLSGAFTAFANLTSIQALTVTLADAGADAIFGWDDTAGAYENLTQAEVLAIIGDAAADGSTKGVASFNATRFQAASGVVDLSASVQTSLDLADSAVQPADNISDLTNDAGYITAASTNTLTNKTFDADGTGNSITNIENADIKAGAAIAVNKLAALTASELVVTDASGFLTTATGVSATEAGYLNGVTSAIQTQLDGKQPLDAGLTSISGLTTAADRMIYTTASDTYAVTTLTSAARSILDDASTSAIRTTLGVGTADSPQFAGINVGNASDTTITRTAAGTIAVEGNVILTKATNFHIKAISIANPTSSEDRTLFFTDDAITVTQLNAVLLGSSTPSVTWTVRHSTDRNATGNEVVTSGTTTTSTTTGSEVTSFNDATIPAGSWVWLETTAQSGTVTELHVSIEYRVD